jgi:ATP-dependent Lon protease
MVNIITYPANSTDDHKDNVSCKAAIRNKIIEGLTYYKSPYNLKQIVNLQIFFRNKLTLITNVRNELIKLSKTVQSIASNLNTLNNYRIISNITYVTYMEKLDSILDNLRYSTPQPINLVNYGGMNSYNFFVGISKMKLELINIIKKCGTSKVDDVIYLITGKSSTTNTTPKLDFYNECFNLISVDIYSIKSDIEILQQLSTNKHTIDEPLCAPLDITYTLFDRIYGVKLYVPVEDRLLIIKGFFKKDNLQYAISTYSFLYDKHRNLYNLLLNYPTIPYIFKKNYINRMQLKELVLLDELEMVNRLQKHYKLLQKYCQKSITNIIKDFLSASIVEKILLLTLLLLDDNSNNNTTFIAYILYDVYIYNQSNVVNNTNSINNVSGRQDDTTIEFQVSQTKSKLHIKNTIYDYLHWKTQIRLKIIFQEMDVIQKNIVNFSDDKIPYEKRIQLICANDLVKSKALTKLKEINSSKGESNAKAQQYLDGLLKIPFGIYKHEPIMRSLEVLIEHSKSSFIHIRTYVQKLTSDVIIKLGIQDFEDVAVKYINKKVITSKELDDIVHKYIIHFEQFENKFESSKELTNRQDDDQEMSTNYKFTDFESSKFRNIFEHDKNFKKSQSENKSELEHVSNDISNDISNFRNNYTKTQLTKMKKRDILHIAITYNNNNNNNNNTKITSMLKKELVVYVLKSQQTKNDSFELEQTSNFDSTDTTIDISDDFKILKEYSGNVSNKLLETETKICVDLLVCFRNLYKDIQQYKCKCAEYLEYVNKSLDESVYGMDEPKKQIKHIIAQWINGTNDGYVFGFEGSPGTGKTTLAKLGIAKCIKDDEGNSRPFAFIALGGSSNGSTLEGHNYTYVGSTWGKIVDTLMASNCMNPIIYIDELDKISRTEHGKEIVGILTHITDMTQNELFNDKYFTGIPIDISKCLIIFSYNDVSKIDKVLLDRIHRIKIKDMNKYEKVEVMKNYVYSQIVESIGFQKGDIILDDNELLHIIDTYTCESGVRKLKEKVFELFREVNYRYLLGHILNFPYKITIEFIEDKFTDKPRVHYNIIAKQPEIGIVNGLFATDNGLGGVLFVECYRTISETRLKLNLTGQQGKTMRESMEVAKTVAWNLLTDEQQHKINTELPFGLHIHCPEAATPKDGPSAGAAIVLTIYSQLLGKKIDNTYALTGEIRLMNGMINKIGGLDLKIGGARKAGVKTVLCPRENEDDLKKILKHPYYPTQYDFEVKMVDTIYDVINLMIID